MNYDSSSFDPQRLHFDIQGYKWISFPNHHRLFELLLGYIASHVVEEYGSGYRMDLLRSRNEGENEENPVGNTQFGRISLRIGYGEYKFSTFDGEEAYAIFQHVGQPVGGDCGPDIMQNLVVFTKSLEKFGKFLSELVTLAEKPEEGKFVCFTWLIRHQYWREEVRVNNRPVQSVVLPTAMKTRLLNDVEKFLSQKTKDFYFRNGIPYRRSYLFHGAPGTGKTSMVQALAGHFKRNVCFLMPTHPEMNDDNLREAIQSIPDNSIVVLEDIDALFTKERENKSGKSSLTFSGLLNALDGIGSPNGQLFVLTTNLRENLDHALIRNGRVDLHVEFTYAVEEQMQLMWSNFYPEAKQLAEQFASAVMTALKEKNLNITTSALQHFFITQMEATPEEALAAVPSIVEEVIRNSSASMLNAARGKKQKNRNKNQRNAEEKKTGSEADEERNEEFVVVGRSMTLTPAPVGMTTASDESALSGEEEGRKGNELKGKKNKKKRNLQNRKNRQEEKEAKQATENTAKDTTGKDTDQKTKVESNDVGETKKRKRNRKKNRDSEGEEDNGKPDNEVQKTASPAETSTEVKSEQPENNEATETVDNNTTPLPKRDKKIRTPKKKDDPESEVKQLETLEQAKTLVTE